MVLVGGVLGLLLADAPLALIAPAWIPPAVLSALGFLIISRRSGTGDVDSSSLPWRHALREGWPYFATTGAVMIYHQIDVVVIALFGDEDATGWYGAADQLYTSVCFISTAALASVLPAMFRIAKRSPSEIDDMARVGLGLMVTAAVPIGLGLVVTGGDIARLVFGAEFDAAGAILALMGLAVVPTYAATFLGQMAIVLGESALWARLMLGAAFATAAIDVVVVPATQRWFSNGGLGGAISYILVETAVAIVGLQRLRPAIVDRKLLMGLVRALAAGLVMLLCVLLVDGWWLGLRVTVGALVYVAAAIMFDVLTPSQRALIAEASPRHRMIQSLIRGPYRRRSTHDIDGNDTNEESVDAPR
ncbi:MAG: oligosaccharide flippase family protein [Acidimicrobiales bacterium]